MEESLDMIWMSGESLHYNHKGDQNDSTIFRRSQKNY